VDACRTYQLHGGIDADGQSVSIGIHSSCRKALHGDVSWKRQHSVMGNATQEGEKEKTHTEAAV